MRILQKMATKYTISSLPIPPSSLLLTHHLTPDSNSGLTASVFRQVLATRPSVQRRARLLPPESHFSYVSPYPIPFPYDVDPPAENERDQDTGSYIEKWLAKREALKEVGPPASSGLTKYTSENRDQPRVLIGLSETGLKDCLPHLDVGDAFTILGAPALLATKGENEPEEGAQSTSASDIAAREDLIDILSGHAMLLSTLHPSSGDPEDERGFAPWSLRYSGHQFGSWAGQLGDGRAISIR
jgi:serine/tyrosine/threonine adenylyltransferase